MYSMIRLYITSALTLIVGFGTFWILLEKATDGSITPIHYFLAAVATISTCAGILLMLSPYMKSIRIESFGLELEDARKPEQIQQTLRQLTKNYDILRKQTTQGFLLSALFMSLGIVVILSGSVGRLFGFTDSAANLTSISGLIMEFISGTALIIYRINFKRLNATSDRLESTWRTLMAFQLAESLPEEQKSEATLRLISSLIRRR